MATKFVAKRDFFSRELKSQYAAGMSYTCRDGQKYDVLRSMLPKWESARIFKALHEIKFLDMEFDASSISYALPGDDFESVVETWVSAGKAEWMEDSGLITFNVPEAAGEISGEG